MAEPISFATLIYCKMCEMFSYSSASFSESQACRKCSLFMDLEARVSELETRLCTKDSVVAHAASQQPLACADRPSLVAVRVVGWRFEGSVARNKGPWFTTVRFMSLTAFPHSVTHPLKNQTWLLPTLFCDMSSRNQGR